MECIIESLKSEHKLIRLALGRLRHAYVTMQLTGQLDRETTLDLLKCLRILIVDVHQPKEELIVLPSLSQSLPQSLSRAARKDQSQDQKQDQMRSKIHDEHGIALLSLKVLIDELSRDFSTRHDADRCRSVLEIFLRAKESHLAHEEATVFPMALVVLSAEQRAKLGIEAQRIDDYVGKETLLEIKRTIVRLSLGEEQIAVA